MCVSFYWFPIQNITLQLICQLKAQIIYFFCIFHLAQPLSNTCRIKEVPGSWAPSSDLLKEVPTSGHSWVPRPHPCPQGIWKRNRRAIGQEREPSDRKGQVGRSVLLPLLPNTGIGIPALSLVVLKTSQQRLFGGRDERPEPKWFCTLHWAPEIKSRKKRLCPAPLRLSGLVSQSTTHRGVPTHSSPTQGKLPKPRLRQGNASWCLVFPSPSSFSCSRQLSLGFCFCGVFFLIRGKNTPGGPRCLLKELETQELRMEGSPRPNSRTEKQSRDSHRTARHAHALRGRPL